MSAGPAPLRARSERRPSAQYADGACWRVRLRSAPMLAFALLGQWNERSEFFRWRWRAKAAAWRHRLSAPRDVLTEASIEPYVPGSNIVRLDRGHRRVSSADD